VRCAAGQDRVHQLRHCHKCPLALDSMYPAQLLRVVNACDQQPHKYAPVNRVRLVLRAATMAGICVPSVAFTRGPSETAMLAGSPAGRIGRLYRLTITATNGVAPAARQAFTLTVHQARPSCRPGDRCSEIRPTQPFPRRQQGISCPCAPSDRPPAARLHIPDSWQRNGRLDRRSCRITGRQAACHQDHREQRRRPDRDPGADHRDPPTVCRMPSRARATSINAPGPRITATLSRSSLEGLPELLTQSLPVQRAGSEEEL
jgi:hypothetical protein